MQSSVHDLLYVSASLWSRNNTLCVSFFFFAPSDLHLLSLDWLTEPKSLTHTRGSRGLPYWNNRMRQPAPLAVRMSAAQIKNTHYYRLWDRFDQVWVSAAVLWSWSQRETPQTPCWGCVLRSTAKIKGLVGRNPKIFLNVNVFQCSPVHPQTARLIGSFGFGTISVLFCSFYHM